MALHWLTQLTSLSGQGPLAGQASQLSGPTGRSGRGRVGVIGSGGSGSGSGGRGSGSGGGSDLINSTKLSALCECLGIAVPAAATDRTALSLLLAEQRERIAVLAITSASHPNEGYCGYLTSAAHFGFPVLTLSWNTTYHDSMRLAALDRVLRCLPGELVVHVSDGSDVVFTNTPATLLEGYRRLQRETGALIYYQAECNAWPRCWDTWYRDGAVQCPAGEMQCYLNSGTLTASVSALRPWVTRLASVQRDHTRAPPLASWLPRAFVNEQELSNAAYASPARHEYRVALDHRGTMSQVLHRCWGVREPDTLRPPDCRKGVAGAAGCAEMCRLTNPKTFRPLDYTTIEGDGTITLVRDGFTERPSAVHCPAKNLGKLISNFTCERLPHMLATTGGRAEKQLLVLVDHGTISHHQICREKDVKGGGASPG